LGDGVGRAWVSEEPEAEPLVKESPEGEAILDFICIIESEKLALVRETHAYPIDFFRLSVPP